MYISGMGEKPAQAVTGQEFCLKWNNHQATLVSILEQQYRQESFVDVTLAVEGVQLMAHKMVLCACSPYFASILTDTPDKHPIVILKDVSPTDMRAILEFMYRGEVSVSEDSLDRLLKVAESLCVRGLADVGSEMHNGTVNTPLTAPGQTQLPSPAPAVTTTSSSPARKKHRRIARSVASPLNVHIPRESPNASSLEPDSASQDPEEIRESEAGRDSSSSGGSPPEKKRKKNQNEEADSQGDEINSSSGSGFSSPNPSEEMFIGPSLGELEPSSPLVCSQCGEVFSTSKSWHHHLQTVHSRFYCKDCAARFKNQKSLELHKLSHRKIKSGVSGLSSLKSDPLDVSAASERKSLPPETRSRRTSEKMFKNEEAFVLDIIERVKQECRGTDLTRRGYSKHLSHLDEVQAFVGGT